MLVCAHCRFACVHNLVSYIGNYSRYTILRYAACIRASKLARASHLYSRARRPRITPILTWRNITTCLAARCTIYEYASVYEPCMNYARINTHASCFMNIGTIDREKFAICRFTSRRMRPGFDSLYAAMITEKHSYVISCDTFLSLLLENLRFEI
jgi:hypothetical protein